MKPHSPSVLSEGSNASERLAERVVSPRGVGEANLVGRSAEGGGGQTFLPAGLHEEEVWSIACEYASHGCGLDGSHSHLANRSIVHKP